jgi:sec-independent protein translocase protein TatB
LHPGVADAITGLSREGRKRKVQRMFGMSGTELAIVLILALLLLGPSKMPELARSLGKAVRDFKRATNDIRGTVESEFYRMDSDPLAEPPKPSVPVLSKPEGVVPSMAPARVEKADEPVGAEAKADKLALELGAAPVAPAPTPAETPAPTPDVKDLKS